MYGINPTLLYGYGGYGITVEPNYDPSKTLFILHGGILAVPHVRGGGAKGNNWSLEGRGLKKRNTVDDFIAAAEYLIDEKYTKSKKLAIMGASHGAMLVGAAITQRPELFKAAIAEAGPFDLLRKDKFTTGAAASNINEYGDVSQKEGFDSLLSYSPLHNIKKGVKYPNILLITGDNDDRVPPLHSYKFLTALQEKGDPTSLYQIYIVEGSGHGGALTSNTFVDYLMFKYYYLYKELDLKFW
jgi:prolyl oligopeptidase